MGGAVLGGGGVGVGAGVAVGGLLGLGGGAVKVVGGGLEEKARR